MHFKEGCHKIYCLFGTLDTFYGVVSSTESCPKSSQYTLILAPETSCSSAHTNLYVSKNQITPPPRAPNQGPQMARRRYSHRFDRVVSLFCR